MSNRPTLTTLAAGLFGFVICCAEDPAHDPAGAAPKQDASTAGTSGAAGAGSAGAAGSQAGSGATATAGGSSGVSDAAGSGGSADSAPDAPASGGSAGSSARVPGDLLDLTNWKLTLPVGEAGSPTEITEPELRTYTQSPYFVLSAARDGVVFHAHAGGVTTSNSGYPRSELREMTNLGADNAAWSTTSGVHTMTMVQAITQLPVVKPHVVAGQIHDASDDVVMVRLEGTHLFVEGGGEELGDLNPSYPLGTRFTVRIRATAGRISVYYDDMNTPKVEIDRDATGCYFKAGAYTQSNPDRGDAPTAYGEVVIYGLTVTHE